MTLQFAYDFKTEEDIIADAIAEVREGAKSLLAMGMLQAAGMLHEDYLEVKDTHLYDLMLTVSILPWVNAASFAYNAYTDIQEDEITEDEAVCRLTHFVRLAKSGHYYCGNAVNWHLDAPNVRITCPTNSAISWSGKGDMPEWVASHVKAGGSVEDLMR